MKQFHPGIQPFIDLVIEHVGFYEWYSVSGEPYDSGIFRGSAGVLMEAIDLPEEWASEQGPE
ncbi:MAG: hypothetical protein ACOCV9_06190 [Marinilabiliaceae bacterium]